TCEPSFTFLFIDEQYPHIYNVFVVSLLHVNQWIFNEKKSNIERLHVFLFYAVFFLPKIAQMFARYGENKDELGYILNYYRLFAWILLSLLECTAGKQENIYEPKGKIGYGISGLIYLASLGGGFVAAKLALNVGINIMFMGTK
ncbi:hypothetical protein ACJX0J_011869, partial [Zea mays]